MSNVIDFPVPAARQAALEAAHSHVGAAFLADPTPHSHAVQFYEEEHFLYETVARFLAAGLSAGDRLVVIATPEHREGFLALLGPHGATDAIASGQLTVLDAAETLSRFMVGEMPDGDLFHDLLGRLLGKMRAGGHQHKRIRAYGEMVDLLWRKGNAQAAICLEELWNDAGKDHSFELLCAYVMGNFYKEGDAQRFMEICRNHSHVMPTERFTQLDDPHARLREISLLQQRACSLETEILHRRELEAALRDALRERKRVEDDLVLAVEREREARTRAEANAQFKEVFLGILGHDLRNPLNTILTTTRMMTYRKDLPEASQTRLERVVTSGVRMQRMIEQLLDVTRARLADGIPVDRKDQQDLVPVVAKIVDELRAAHPTRTIQLCSDGPCFASVDPDRLEQVVSNLVGNALTHGDPAKPVEVTIASRSTVVSLSVHNFGPPIDPHFMPLLFDPFKRGHEPQIRSAGLGLGLYISERIVSAHGGKIAVESDVDTGTRFEVILPRGR